MAFGYAMPSWTRKYSCPEGSVYVIVAEHKGKPYYVDLRISKAGGNELAAAANALGILVGTSIRRGAGIGQIKSWLRGISVVDQDKVKSGEYQAQSIADALGRALEDEYLA